jgi:hypothetical protein
MKNLFIIFISIFSFACKKKVEDKPVLPTCTCKDLNILKNYIDQEGEIEKQDSTHYLLINTKGDISSRFGTYCRICTDSLFLNQIKIKQIQDHSIVKFTGDILGGEFVNPCEAKPVLESSTRPFINIKSIDLK